MRTLLHLIPSMSAAAGGPPIVVRQFAAQGRSRGWKQSLLSISARGMPASPRDGRDDFETVGELPSGSRLAELWPGRRAIEQLHAAVAASDMVMLHGLWHPLLSRGTRICTKLSRPYVVMLHGMLSGYSLAAKALMKRAGLAAFERRTLSNASMLIFATPEEEISARRAMPGLRHGIVVPLAPEPTTSEEPAAFLQAFPALSDRRIVLSLGRIHHIKGLDRLIAALPEAFAGVDDAMLALAGPGDPEYIRHLTRMVARIGMTDRVVWTGPLDARLKSSAFAASTIFALPSRHESFGIAIMEALGAGLPVVVSNSVAIAGAVTEAHAGIVLSEQDVGRDLGPAIRRLLTNREEARLMGERGRALVMERFTWEHSGAILYEALDSIARQYGVRDKQAEESGRVGAN